MTARVHACETVLPDGTLLERVLELTEGAGAEVVLNFVGETERSRTRGG